MKIEVKLILNLFFARLGAVRIKMEDYIVVIYLRHIIQSPKEKLHRINPLFHNVVKNFVANAVRFFKCI